MFSQAFKRFFISEILMPLNDEVTAVHVKELDQDVLVLRRVSSLSPAPTSGSAESDWRYVVVSGTPEKILEHLLNDLHLEEVQDKETEAIHILLQTSFLGLLIEMLGTNPYGTIIYGDRLACPIPVQPSQELQAGGTHWILPGLSFATITLVGWNPGSAAVPAALGHHTMVSRSFGPVPFLVSLGTLPAVAGHFAASPCNLDPVVNLCSIFP
uniref:Uncharacterized protein n=1 Tax=Sphaerodactylus townsendi TaxID=933632 RepID=A0ACB8FVC3_9SAUR